MDNEKIVKCIIDLERIYFPKRCSYIQGGQFAIFMANVLTPISGCEDIYNNIKLKGTTCEINYGEKYKVTCKLAESSEKYGDTYEIIYINRLVDLKDKVKQRNFLMSILNENVVDRLYATYHDVIELLENEDIKSLTKVKGIGTTTALRLIQKYKNCKDFSEIYTELGHIGFSSNMIKKLVEYYKSPDLVIDQVKSNPYDLVNIDGIGFKKADEIAEKLGIKGSNPNRVKGCILYILSQNGINGKSYLHYSELMKILYDNIGYIEQDIINKVAFDLIADKEVYVSEDGEYIGLNIYRQLEENIAKELIRLLNAEDSRVKINDIETIISNTEQIQGFEFTQEQRDAIYLFSKNNVVAITGGAGVGKSSVAKGMSEAISKYIKYGTALSGKASVRIKEATEMESKTIHKLLGYQHGEFYYNSQNQLDCDAIFIDESTMISGELFLSLLKAIPSGAKVVLIGDIQQLTPIGSCQVFSDVLNSNIPNFKLTKPHRQAMRSGIIPLSLNIINQKHIFDSTFEGNIILGELQDMELDIYKSFINGSDIVVNHFLKQYKKTNDLMETQIIVPLKNRGDVCTYKLNIEVQSKINPVSDSRKHILINLDKERFYQIQIGDKVINTKNNYKATTVDGEDIAVFNGNMGIVKNIEDEFVTVDFVGLGEVILDSNGVKNLELGYAITVHKSQGSGFDTVIGAIDSSAYVMLNAELLYTLVTRAKKYCVLVGKNSAIRSAITKREIKNKQTYLTELLR